MSVAGGALSTARRGSACLGTRAPQAWPNTPPPPRKSKPVAKPPKAPANPTLPGPLPAGWPQNAHQHQRVPQNTKISLKNLQNLPDPPLPGPLPGIHRGPKRHPPRPTSARYSACSVASRSSSSTILPLADDPAEYSAGTVCFGGGGKGDRGFGGQGFGSELGWVGLGWGGVMVVLVVACCTCLDWLGSVLVVIWTRAEVPWVEGRPRGVPLPPKLPTLPVRKPPPLKTVPLPPNPPLTAVPSSEGVVRVLARVTFSKGWVGGWVDGWRGGRKRGMCVTGE